MRSQCAKRPALTLVELLVVVTILVILVAVVLPLAQPVLRGREVREGARQLNTFIARVQSDSIGKGRPHGVQLVRSESDPLRCFELQQVKYRSLFAGLHDDSRVSRTGKVLSFEVLPSDRDWDTYALLDNLIKRTQTVLIRFDYRGNWVPIRRNVKDIAATGAGGPSSGAPKLEFPPNVTIPANFPDGASVPYQIKLPPRPTATAAPELPQGAFIDLAVSGPGIGNLPKNQFKTNKQPITIMFDTEGRLSEYRQLGLGPPKQYPDTMFLLVRNEDPDAPSYWVTIGSKTNRIVTTENLGTRDSALAGISASGR